MRVEDLLMNADGSAALAKIATAFGISQSEAKSAMGSMLPEMTQRIERNSFSRGGIADLIGAIGNDQNQRVLEHPELAATPAAREIGNGALDVIFGNKDTSRGVAARAAKASGLDSDLTKQLLPSLAAMVIGALGKNGAPALGEVMSKIATNRVSGAGGSPLPLPGEKPDWSSSGRGSINGGSRPPLDLPDEMPRAPKSGGTFGGSPLPMPNDDILRGPRGNNPYGDLPDIIRRGGTSVPGGGSLSNIIKGILASILGYQNRGFLSWIIRLIVVRYGGAILKAIFRRVTGAR